jgi:hypothetical protein
MNDLASLLDRAAGPSASPDATADLTRGRRALARTRRRRGAAGLVGVAAAAAVGVGAAQRLTDTEPQLPVAEAQDHQDELRAVRVQAGPYTLGVTPVGWSVQGHRPGSVTFAADDGTSDPHPDAYVGKIVLLFDTERLFGNPAVRDGREFRVNENESGITVATRTRDGEPEGTLWLQVPGHLGWSVDTAIEMLDGVRVGEGAIAPQYDPDATYRESPGGGFVIFGD